MIDVSMIITIIVSIILAFAGIIFGIIGTQSRKFYERMLEEVDSNTRRIGVLELQEARREAEFNAIIQSLKELKSMFETHKNDHNRGRT